MTLPLFGFDSGRFLVMRSEVDAEGFCSDIIEAIPIVGVIAAVSVPMEAKKQRRRIIVSQA